MHDTLTDKPITLPLRNLKLRPGMSIQVDRVEPGSARKELQFLASLSNKGVMVGPHGASGPGTEGSALKDMGLKKGDDVVVRGFTGQYDFAFESRVTQIFTEPFVYALLNPPAEVQALQVRQALRMKTTWPAQVLCAGASAPVDTTILDLSVAGAMVKTFEALGNINNTVKLSLSVKVENKRTDMLLAARICYSLPAADGQGFQTGLQFMELTQNEWLALHYLSNPPSQMNALPTTW